MGIEEFEGNENEQDKTEVSLESLNLSAGEYATIRKVTLSEDSAVAEGQEIQGRLLEDVQIGGQMKFDNGGQTSNIDEVYEEGGKIFIKTATSVYELTTDTVEERTHGEFNRIDDESGETIDTSVEVLEDLYGKYDGLENQINELMSRDLDEDRFLEICDEIQKILVTESDLSGRRRTIYIDIPSKQGRELRISVHEDMGNALSVGYTV